MAAKRKLAATARGSGHTSTSPESSGSENAADWQDEEEVSEMDSDGFASAADEDSDDAGASALSGTDEAPDQEPPRKKKKKQPQLTTEEIRALSFAQLAASPLSASLTTRVGLLLDKLTPPSPSSSPLQPVLKELHSHFVSLKPKKPVSLEDLARGGTTVPHLYGIDDKWLKLAMPWQPPESSGVRITGEWPWQGATKDSGSYVVEMAVAMPAPKDCMHPRFLAKSTHYLVHLASHLPKSLGEVEMHYVTLPASRGWSLDVRAVPNAKRTDSSLSAAKGAILRIHITWPDDCFALGKTGPSANLARPPHGNESSQNALPATPCRSSALHAASLQFHLTSMTYKHEIARNIPAYGATCRLVRHWAQNHSYGETLGLTSEFWSWCVARAAGLAGDGASDVKDLSGSAWAIWRKTIEWLGSVKWDDGVWFRSDTPPKYSRDEFKRAFNGRPVFIDPTGSVNIAAGIDPSVLAMLRRDARATLSMLFAISSDVDQFDAVFSRPLTDVERFDNVYRIRVPTTFLQTSQHLDTAPAETALHSLSDTLHRALGTRVTDFYLRRSTVSPIPVVGRMEAQAYEELTLGVVLDRQESNRLADQGPSAEDEEACADFRDFWGAKAELRRFKDGSIVQTVVWDAPLSDGLGIVRPTIVGTIIEYILGHRHNIPPADIFQFKASFDNVLVESQHIRRAIYLEDAVATSKGFSSIVGAFNNLSKQLQSLSGIPLAITSVQPSFAALRYTSTLVPSPRRLDGYQRQSASTKFIEAFDVVIGLEGSGRWPDDLEGVQKIKAAFLAKIGEQLESQQLVRAATVCFDTDARPIEDNVSLEIVTPAGFAFRARLYHERSRMLLLRRINQLQLSDDQSLAEYERRFKHAPAHHAALSTLQHHHPSFSPASRLLKRWLASHMLLPHVPEELVELIAAQVFIDAQSQYDPPASGVTAFARIMRLLATWKWQEAPLLIPLYSAPPSLASGKRVEYPPELRETSLKAFEMRRAQDRKIDHFAWVVCTEQDPEGKVWGEDTNKVVSARIKTLAKATLAAIIEGVEKRSLEPLTLFTPDMSAFAFLISVDAELNPRSYQAINSRISPLRPKSLLSSHLPGDDDEDDIKLDFDPLAELVSSIKAMFGDLVMLFYDPAGGNTIGGIWNPSYEAPKAFKANMGYPVRPVIETGKSDGSTKVVLDKEAVLEDIKSFGAGFVTSVEHLQ